MIRAYLFALEPTPAQEEMFRSHCGGQRFAYNWGLALVKANLDQRAAERSYGILDDELTPLVSWSAYDLSRLWNRAKIDIAPWWGENSKHVYGSGLANLSVALKNWNQSRTKKRKGPSVRFPRFKSSRSYLSCKFTDGVRITTDRRHIKLPRIGSVRTGESTRKLVRRIEAGMARIRGATLSYQRGRWHVSLSVDLPDCIVTERDGNRTIGVDLGIKSLAVFSNGDTVPNPRSLGSRLNELRRLQRTCARRQGPDRRTKQVPSNRWRKARARANNIHTRVSAMRRNGLHQLTTRLVRDHDVIVIEDLNVAGLVRNRRLARHISGLGMGEFRRQLTYKAQDASARLIIANRWYPSSKTCSACGVVKAKLTLAERVFNCESCGFRLDRDLNAARNLAALAAEASEQSCGRTLNEPDGNPRKTSLAGNGYCHGKTPNREPTSHHEVMAS